MFVNNVILPSKKLITVSPKESVKRAFDLIEENNFLSIPVAEGDKFYGAISKERIYAFYFEKSLDKKVLLEDFLVENVMRTDVPTISPLANIEEAAHFLEVKNTAFVAVIDEYGSFKGIVTHHAVFHEFTELFGVDKGKRIAVIAYDIPGQISKLSRLITENNGNIISFVVVDPKTATEVKEIVVRLKTDNYDEIVKKIKNAGFQVQ
ncbi:CBS domain protein [Clostridium tepidiprofundi DSM 19306]|uniref:CBS domain protein n=1 Tax=Clostridium tepidiprofundi DSM 19306 TaxID=1121338 RepID=A0A151AXZ5_9CLOT|nr:CBS domain-containing protein [Clostridium tepidiprofundi]KYH32423.1 CBS domain protein [Clostridium tepidiprofundi DSM 19306]